MTTSRVTMQSPGSTSAEDGTPLKARARTKSRRTSKPLCKLDADGCLCLRDVLLSFNGPVSQEQAWALYYQTAKTLSRSPRNKHCELTELSQILLHKDGDVRLLDSPIGVKRSLVSERKLVLSLGIIIYDAIDFGLDEEEERILAPDLISLISLMTHSNLECEPDAEERLQETDDEGIERDSGENELDELPLQRTDDAFPPSPSPCSLENILQLCTKHAQGTSEVADTHYRAVIRALVAEALELSQFLEKVAAEKQQHERAVFRDSASSEEIRDGFTSTQSLDALDFSDWARFWVQVIGELRRGVKLKKVEADLGKCGTSRGLGRGAEFELTPYEILMDDIRTRRYRLRKTPKPSPHCRKDAHAVILEFIRSRPPLKKASERKLPPLQKQATPRELLMESIKAPPKPLRSSSLSPSAINRLQGTRAKGHPQEDNGRETRDTSEKDARPTPTSRRGSTDLSLSDLRQPRRLIPVDFDLKLDGEEDDDDEEFAVTRFEDEDDAASFWRSKESCFEGRDRVGKEAREEGTEDDDDDDDKSSANPWRKGGGLRLTRNEYHRFCDAQLESYDLATQCPSRRASARKHAIGANIVLPSLAGTASLPHSRPHSRQHKHHHRHEGSAGLAPSVLDSGPSPATSLSPASSPSPKIRTRPRPRLSGNVDKESQERNADDQSEQGVEQKASLGDMFLDERLSLTLEEIVHIRSVLTKAELESLPVEGRVKEDVEKRRVCFLCLKTRFGILGPWGQRCRLCDRTVCVKCCSKMRIPTEHFAHVPVVLLSPGLLLSPTSSESDSGVKNLWLRPSGVVGSAPASPAARRRDSALRSSTPTPAATPTPLPTPHSQDSGSEKGVRKCGGSPAKLLSLGSLGGGLSAEQRLAAERLRGVAMIVCHDCRILVIQIIKSSRTTRATIRNNVISRLTLNLSPVYV